MPDGPNVRRHNVLGRLRDWWDSWDREAADPRRAVAAEPRRALIPDYEVYEPPPSRWKRVRSVDSEDVRFGAFIVVLCLAALLVLTVLIAAIARSTGLDVPWLSTVAIILVVAAFFSFWVAFPDAAAGNGEGGGGG
jgi:hypothetical protein